MRRARARRQRHADLPAIARLQQVAPILGHRQRRPGPLRPADRGQREDLMPFGRQRRAACRVKTVMAGDQGEGFGRGGPEDVEAALVAARHLLQCRVGVLVQHQHLGTRMLGAEGLDEGIGQRRRHRGQDPQRRGPGGAGNERQHERQNTQGHARHEPSPQSLCMTDGSPCCRRKWFEPKPLIAQPKLCRCRETCQNRPAHFETRRDCKLPARLVADSCRIAMLIREYPCIAFNGSRLCLGHCAPQDLWRPGDKLRAGQQSKGRTVSNIKTEGDAVSLPARPTRPTNPAWKAMKPSAYVNN